MPNDPSERLVFNGINGASGGYLLDPMTPDELEELVRGEKLPQEQLDDLSARHVRDAEQKMGVSANVDDPNDVSQAGWGVIFPRETDPKIRDALQELLDYRKKQATRNGSFYREYSEVEGYWPDETKASFLSRHGASTGEPADPALVPYYLLIVGDPKTIPYAFQYQMDVEYAVGRISFDTPEEYARYAHSVVAAETGGFKAPRSAVLFGVQNPDDGATALSAEYLVKPLSARLSNYRQWNSETLVGEPALKAKLLERLGGPSTPTLLFTASHGMGFPKDDAHQLPHQGALLCQNWPGPEEWQFGKPIPQDYYVAGDDIAADARLFGLISFHFACYGAGTPQLDDFAHRKSQKIQPDIAPYPFVARLPQRLLAHPRGGALAVVGHIERAWDYSFRWAQTLTQVQVFESALKSLMKGQTVGHALEYMNERYAALATDLSQDLYQLNFGKQIPSATIAGKWTANNDARNYIILGDPAVRLNLADDAAQPAATRPVVEVQTTPASTSAAGKPKGGAKKGTQFDASAAGAVAEVAAMPPSPDDTARDESFGLFDGNALQQTKTQLLNALKEFADRLGPALKKSVDEASTLQVTTYVSDDMAQVKYDDTTGEFSGAQRRAVTRIRLDGDTLVCVPEREGEIDEQLWAIHADMVGRAQASRAELVKAIVTAAGELLNSIKA